MNTVRNLADRFSFSTTASSIASPLAPTSDEENIMGSKQSKISTPRSPIKSVLNGSRSPSRSPGGKVIKNRSPGRNVGRQAGEARNIFDHLKDAASANDEEDEEMTENSAESDGGVDIDKDAEMAGSEDFGSHHSSLAEDPSDREANSDAESHPSGIGSDRSVHTDPEEEPEYDYEPDDDEMPGDTKVDYFLEVQHKVRLQEHDTSSWHDTEIKLFNELDLRGTQPLLPLAWAGDFPTCPPLLFSDDYDQTFLNSLSGDEFAAARALRELVALGSRVRSVVAGSRTREKVIRKAIMDYVAWAAKDGGYADKEYDPILTITAGQPGQEISAITEATQSEMAHLATLQREALLLEDEDESHPVQYSMDPPLIFGVMIVGTIFVFVTLDSAIPDAAPKTIAHFNYVDPTMDVWNAFAIAIFVTYTRDWMAGRLEDLDDLPMKADVDA